jgi:hypothetical protein
MYGFDIARDGGYLIWSFLLVVFTFIIIYFIYKFMQDTKKLQDLPFKITKLKIFFLNGSNSKDANKKVIKNFGRIESTASYFFNIKSCIEAARLEAKYNLAKQAKLMGANGITNFTIQRVTYNSPIDIFEASGNAVLLEDINRKNVHNEHESKNEKTQEKEERINRGKERNFLFLKIGLSIVSGLALIYFVFNFITENRTKEHILLNINKTKQLYKINEGNIVTNNFLFLFQNTDSKTHTYALEIVDHPDIKIKRFKPFKLDPKKMSKKVVILQTDKILVNDVTKDTPITVTIRAYAIDEPQKVSVLRKAVFIYPKIDKLK